MAKRQLLIVRIPDDDGEKADVPIPLGSASEIRATLGDHNIASDVPNGDFLYGPGITLQMPMTGNDDIMQVLCSLVDEDVAWPVLMRLCRVRGWSLMDPESGRMLRMTESTST